MIKWGILSTASIAERAIVPSILKLNNSKLVAIASRTMTKASELATKFGCIPLGSYEELLQRTDINAVYIPLPTGLHFEWVTKALEVGKHVLVEKSATASYQNSKEIVELARSKGLLLMENFQFQFHNQHQFVKNYIKEGNIGEIRGFKSSFGFPPFNTEDNIRYKNDLGGGALLDAGAYTLKATTFMLGNDFEVKSSQLVHNEKYNVDWYGGAFLSNNKNLFSNISFGFDNFYQCNYQIWGSEGIITSNRAFTAKPNFNPTLSISTNKKTNQIITLPSDNHYIKMLNYFSTLILNKEENRIEKELNNIMIQSKLIECVKNLSTKCTTK